MTKVRRMSLEELDMNNIYKILSDNLTKEEIETVNFCFWVTFFAENFLKKILSKLFRKLVKDHHKGDPLFEEFIDTVVNEHYFMGKIGIFKTMKVHGFEEFLKLSGELNAIRNRIAHGKLKDLSFRGKPINLPKTKQKILDLLIDAINKSS